MMRRILIQAALALSLAVALPAPAGAQSVKDTVLAELRQQGYTQISVRRTLLGRIRIEAESPEFYREIVLNPSTGAILRDYWRRKVGVIAVPQIFDSSGISSADVSESGSGETPGASSGSGSGDDDDDSNDEDKEDEEDEEDEPEEPDESDDGL